MQERKQLYQHEAFVKDEYMKKWVSISEADARKRQEEEQQKKMKKVELQDYLLKQMG